MNKIVFLVAALFILIGIAPKAQATSGPGCLYVVNVAKGDALNMRAKPRLRSRIVDRLGPTSHGIIHLDGKCGPSWKKWGQRWCPVTHYNGDGISRGWVKARFVRDTECP